LSAIDVLIVYNCGEGCRQLQWKSKDFSDRHVPLLSENATICSEPPMPLLA